MSEMCIEFALKYNKSCMFNVCVGYCEQEAPLGSVLTPAKIHHGHACLYDISLLCTIKHVHTCQFFICWWFLLEIRIIHSKCLHFKFRFRAKQVIMSCFFWYDLFDSAIFLIFIENSIFHNTEFILWTI